MFRSTEQANFSAIVAKHISEPDGPLLLEGATGIGKTRAYLKVLMDGAKKGKRYTIVVPSHQLIDQLLGSSDIRETHIEGVRVIAFRPLRFFENKSQYNEQKNLALNAEIMVCTSASIIIDQRLGGKYNGATERDYILFDEADQLPDMAALQSDQDISIKTFKENNVKVEDPRQAVAELLKKKGLEPETRAAGIMILEALDEPAWFYKVGINSDGGVSLYHKMPGRLLKKIANKSNVAFVSATLSIGDNFHDFKMALGIKNESYLSRIIEPEMHGKLTFDVSDIDVKSPEWLELNKSIIENALKPVLVVTPSHDLASVIGQMINGSIVRNKEENETSTQAAARMGDSQVLIATGAWAGLDTPIKWASVIIPRIPYDAPMVLDENIESSFLNSRNKAIRRMKQVIGRGLRSSDAECTIYILDGRYRNIESFIPKRFRPQWQSKTFLEGKRLEITLSKAERDPSIRKHAIKTYGEKCMGCGLAPRSSSVLDVHHLYPVSEGERQTKIEDLVVLCANCHRLIHTTKPPMSLDSLITLNSE